MIQLKATCLRCEGTGYIHNTTDQGGRRICLDCNGEGTIILTSQNWDISLEQVPPFSPKETKEIKESVQKRNEQW